nr:hypothetical protein [Candidatus Sigynarchaeota archaeon]
MVIPGLILLVVGISILVLSYESADCHGGFTMDVTCSPEWTMGSVITSIAIAPILIGMILMLCSIAPKN